MMDPPSRPDHVPHSHTGCQDFSIWILGGHKHSVNRNFYIFPGGFLTTWHLALEENLQKSQVETLTPFTTSWKAILSSIPSGFKGNDLVLVSQMEEQTHPQQVTGHCCGCFKKSTIGQRKFGKVIKWKNMSWPEKCWQAVFKTHWIWW
jgi:hypothetical protein